MDASRLSMNLLRRCFSDEEWTWLVQEFEFQNALLEFRALDEAEEMIKLGLRLISSARRGTLPSGRPPPALIRVWR